MTSEAKYLARRGTERHRRYCPPGCTSRIASTPSEGAERGSNREDLGAADEGGIDRLRASIAGRAVSVTARGCPREANPVHSKAGLCPDKADLGATAVP